MLAEMRTHSESTCRIKHHEDKMEALNYMQLTAEDTLNSTSMTPGPNLTKARLGLMLSCCGSIPLMIVTMFSMAMVK